MNCNKCKKQFEKNDLRCGLSVKNNNGWKTNMVCGDCHTKEWNERKLEDIRCIALSCNSVAQLNGAWRESMHIARWRKRNEEYYNKAIKVFEERKAMLNENRS